MQTKTSDPEIMTSAVIILALFELLRKRGITPKKIEERTGIPGSCINDPEIRIPYTQLLGLLRFAIEVTDDPALALHVWTEHGKGLMHFVNYIAMDSNNLLDAAKHLSRYSRLICNADRWEIREEDQKIIITYTITSPEHQNVWMPEHSFLLLTLKARDFTKNQINPVEVWFQHPAPDYASEYQKIFRALVRFDQEENAIIFNKEDLLQKNTNRNHHLQAVLIKQAEASLEHLGKKDSLQQKVLQLIVMNLPKGNIDIEMVSRQLYTNRSTLHRRLKQEGASFTSLLESTRKELAVTYLKQGMNVTQVTYLLGFANPGAMQNAFKRWYNKSPGQFRKEILLI